MSAINRLDGMSEWDIAFADPAAMRELYDAAEKEANEAQELKQAEAAAARAIKMIRDNPPPQEPPAPDPGDSFFLS